MTLPVTTNPTTARLSWIAAVSTAFVVCGAATFAQLPSPGTNDPPEGVGIDERLEVGPQRREIDVDACHRQLTEAEPQAGDAVFAFDIESDGASVGTVDTVTSQPGQHRAGADFDEGAHTAVDHGAHLLDKSHWLDDLSREYRAD